MSLGSPAEMSQYLYHFAHLVISVDIRLLMKTPFATDGMDGAERMGTAKGRPTHEVTSRSPKCTNQKREVKRVQPSRPLV